MIRDHAENENYGALEKIAHSPDGQRLLSLIEQQGGSHYRTAMEQAEQGDYAAVKEMLSKILATQEARQLIERIRNNQ